MVIDEELINYFNQKFIRYEDHIEFFSHNFTDKTDSEFFYFDSFVPGEIFYNERFIQNKVYKAIKIFDYFTNCLSYYTFTKNDPKDDIIVIVGNKISSFHINRILSLSDSCKNMEIMFENNAKGQIKDIKFYLALNSIKFHIEENDKKINLYFDENKSLFFSELQKNNIMKRLKRKFPSKFFINFVKPIKKNISFADIYNIIKKSKHLD